MKNVYNHFYNNKTIFSNPKTPYVSTDPKVQYDPNAVHYMLSYRLPKTEFKPIEHFRYNLKKRRHQNALKNFTGDKNRKNVDSIAKNPLRFFSFDQISKLQSMPLKYEKPQLTIARSNAFNLRNSTKLHMIEERIDKLEKKNNNLEIINNIFFDVFNNVVNDKLKQKKYIRKHMALLKKNWNLSEEEKTDQLKYLENIAKDPNVSFDDEGNIKDDIRHMEGKFTQFRTDVMHIIYTNNKSNDAAITNIQKSIEAMKKGFDNDLSKIVNIVNGNQKILDEIVNIELKRKTDEKIFTPSPKALLSPNRNNLVQRNSKISDNSNNRRGIFGLSPMSQFGTMSPISEKSNTKKSVTFSNSNDKSSNSENSNDN